MVPTEAALREMVYGGAVLGGGGGGSIDAGLAGAREAFARGQPRIVGVSELPESTTIVTLSMVGTVGGTTTRAPGGRHFARALQVFGDLATRRIGGFIASEVGPTAVTYGLRESGLTGIPVVDAPCNGRAHPLSVMGSLGLHRLPAHLALTTAVGGTPGTPGYVELAIRANVTAAARMVRDRVSQAAIALVVVRNPVPASFVRRRAAVGGLDYARRLGRVLLSSLRRGMQSVLESLARHTGGSTIASGHVTSAHLRERAGFTVGKLVIARSDRTEVIIPVCNEYMLALAGGQPLASFPDLIAVFDHASGLPLASSEVTPGRRVAVFAIPRRHLILGSPMRDRALLRPIEKLLGLRFPTSIGAPGVASITALEMQ